jgi:hypothetical protein
MPTTKDADAELLTACEVLFEKAAKDPDALSPIAEEIEALINAAERAGVCSRVVIFRLRKRLAAFRLSPLPPVETAVRKHGHG